MLHEGQFSTIEPSAAGAFMAKAMDGLAMETHYKFEAFDKAGKPLWTEHAHNRVVTVGLNQLLTNAFKSTTVNSPWYVGIVKPEVTDVVVTNGSSLITSPSAPWQTVDALRSIVVRGVGAAGVDLMTTIASASAAGTISLTANPSISSTAAAAIWEARSTDTSTAHSPWLESTFYTGTRPALTLGTAAAGSIDNSASVAAYAISADNTLVGGAFIANSSALLATGDILYGMAPFTSNGFRQLNNGDTLNVTVTLTAASA